MDFSFIIIIIISSSSSSSSSSSRDEIDEGVLSVAELLCALFRRSRVPVCTLRSVVVFLSPSRQVPEFPSDERTVVFF
jgi:hypothetical protein